jgi:hypothetical protein
MKRADKETATNKHIMFGGPFNGKSIFLKSAGTLTFSCVVKGQHWNGHYDTENYWVSV